MLKKYIKRFLTNTSGNFAIIFALVSMPMIVAIGSSIDFLRISNSKAQLQSAVEASVLAAASLTNDQPVNAIVQEYIDANLGSDTSLKNVTFNLDTNQIRLNNKVIKVTAEGDLELTFLQLFGSNTRKITATAEASEETQSIELVMALDISGSMEGDRITNLKSAASDFVDELLSDEISETETSISLVPFGGSVNIGNLFDDYAVDLSSATINPSENQYSIGYGITGENFRFTDGLNCIELTKEDFDLDLIPEQSRPQIPHFWKWNDFRPWCPEAESAVLMNTNNADTLKERIQGMTLSDGTGSDHGLLWAAKALSPSFRGRLGGDFPERPHDFSDLGPNLQKVVVLMSDGAITFQSRPEDYSRFNTHTIPRDNENDQTLLERGEQSDTAANNTAIGNFKEICADLKAQGVTIFTIGFQIRADSFPEELLKFCATNPANYFLVESLDISKAFDAIAVSIKRLRVSG